MKTLLRFTALATLAAFLGLTSLEAFHTHAALQTSANCAVCQIAHKTPTHLCTASAASPGWAATDARTDGVLPSYAQFLFTAHGLSPPTV